MSDTKIKDRILLLEHYFEENTDELHTLTTEELIAICEQNGCRANRNTIRDDISALKKSGLDIITDQKGKSKAFYIGNSLFELAEIKTLIDAVSSSRFITEQKSSELIEKLTKLTSVYNRDALTDNAIFSDRIKTDSSGIFLTIDTINAAISEKKKIRFRYVDYLPTKEKILRHDGKWYVVSPQTLIWNDDRYYVPSYSEEKSCIVPLRIDRMRNVELTDETAVHDNSFDPAEYCRKVLKMYDGDVEEQIVTLEAPNRYMLNVIDRFGEDILTEQTDEKHFIAKISVRPSSTFFAWIFQFEGDIRILKPENVKERYQEMLNRVNTAQNR